MAGLLGFPSEETLNSIGSLQFTRRDLKMGEIGLLLVGWDGQTRRTRWDRGRMEGPALSDAVLGEPALALEVQRVAGSDSCQKFHQCCRGRRVFVPVQQNNHNMLHTNLDC